MAGGARQRVRVALLALGATACGTVVMRPLTAPGWTDCTVAELPGTVRHIHCESLDLRLMQAQTLAGADGVDAIAKGLPGGEATRREIIRVGSVDVPARVHPDYLVAAPRADVLAYCSDPTPGLAGCRNAVAVIARDGLPPGVAFPEPRLELLGHPFVVPPGCALAGTERIVCERTGFALDWREQQWEGGADAALTVGGQLLRSRYPHVDEERVPCVLVGRKGVGARFTVRKDSAVLYALACAVDRGGVTSVA